MRTAIIIPARYGSTRFPGKPLAEIAGQSMLSRVVDLARTAAAKYSDIDVLVATDDQRIADHADAIGVEHVMTGECATGSDRVLAAVKESGKAPEFVLNLQGDAPFTPAAALHAILKGFEAYDEADVITPVHALRWDDLDRLRESKKTTPFSGTTAVVDAGGKAIWFSKTILPAIRKEEALRGQSDVSPVLQHMGLYGYRMEALERFCALPEGTYEALEGLEQLRMLENGMHIQCVPIEIEAGAMQSGIDTPEDLERAEALL